MFDYLALLMLIDTSLACWSKGEEPGKPGKNNTEILLKYLSKMQGGSNPAFNGFEVPDSVKKEWADWLAEYKAKQLQDMEDTKDFYADGGPGAGIPGWPENWKGFHKGDEGFPPQEVPPWGYKAKNLGLPTLCYLNADAGNCGNSTVRKRWGFNAHMQECMEFDYSGCGGNNNNFDTEIACYEKCSNPVTGGCDMETDIQVKDISIAGMPGRRCGRTVQERDSHGRTIH